MGALPDVDANPAAQSRRVKYAAVANAIYSATGIRVREYPISLDKLLPGLPVLS